MNDEETKKIRTALELIDIEREELYERKRVSVADAIEILNDISSALYGDLELEEEDWMNNDATTTNELDQETIDEIREIVRKHIVATMITVEDNGNWVIDMVTEADA